MGFFLVVILGVVTVQFPDSGRLVLYKVIVNC